MVVFDPNKSATEATIINMIDKNDITLYFSDHGEHTGFHIDELMPLVIVHSNHFILNALSSARFWKSNKGI